MPDQMAEVAIVASSVQISRGRQGHPHPLRYSRVCLSCHLYPQEAVCSTPHRQPWRGHVVVKPLSGACPSLASHIAGRVPILGVLVVNWRNRESCGQLSANGSEQGICATHANPLPSRVLRHVFGNESERRPPSH